MIRNRLRELRKQRGLTQIQLGERAARLAGGKREEFSQSYISRMEAGGQNPTMKTWFAFARALDCSPADLLAPEDNPHRLDATEQRLIASFRELDSDARERVLLTIAESLAATRRPKTPEQLTAEFRDAMKANGQPDAKPPAAHPKKSRRTTRPDKATRRA